MQTRNNEVVFFINKGLVLQHFETENALPCTFKVPTSILTLIYLLKSSI